MVVDVRLAQVRRVTGLVWYSLEEFTRALVPWDPSESIPILTPGRGRVGVGAKPAARQVAPTEVSAPSHCLPLGRRHRECDPAPGCWVMFPPRPIGRALPP